MSELSKEVDEIKRTAELRIQQIRDARHRMHRELSHMQKVITKMIDDGIDSVEARLAIDDGSPHSVSMWGHYEDSDIDYHSHNGAKSTYAAVSPSSWTVSTTANTGQWSISTGPTGPIGAVGAYGPTDGITIPNGGHAVLHDVHIDDDEKL